MADDFTQRAPDPVPATPAPMVPAPADKTWIVMDVIEKGADHSGMETRSDD